MLVENGNLLADDPYRLMFVQDCHLVADCPYRLMLVQNGYLCSGSGRACDCSDDRSDSKKLFHNVIPFSLSNVWMTI